MHIINRLYTEEFDFSTFLDDPNKSLMISSLPRSGSTIFCQHLWRTGVLGAPLEYPCLQNRQALFERLNCLTWSEYWRKVKECRTSPNGVFAYKMFVSNLVHIARKQADLYPQIKATHVVYLTRNDILAQAISHSRAVRSNVWFYGVSPDKDIAFDEKHVKYCLNMIKRQKGFWEDFFHATNANVYRVTYEDFIADSGRIIRDVGNFIDEEIRNVKKIDIPLISIQRDKVTDLWKKMYLNNNNDPSID